MTSYDARGHGESDPAPAELGYSYAELAGDLACGDRGDGGRGDGDRSPATRWAPTPRPRTRSLTPTASPRWWRSSPPRGVCRRAQSPWPTGTRSPTASSADGVDGFIAAYDHDLDPRWRETLVRIARERLGLHRHPEAVARALREVPRSIAFDGLSELEFLDVPALVVASHDEADPSHPYAVAEAWAAALPQGELISEDEGAVAAGLAGGTPLPRDRELLRAPRRRRAASGLAGHSRGLCFGHGRRGTRDSLQRGRARDARVRERWRRGRHGRAGGRQPPRAHPRRHRDPRRATARSASSTGRRWRGPSSGRSS